MTTETQQTTTPPPNETILDGYVTGGYLRRIFNKSSLTILHWRQRDGLPYVRICGDGRDTIRYKLEDVLKWAEEAGKQVDQPGKPRQRLRIFE